MKYTKYSLFKKELFMRVSLLTFCLVSFSKWKLSRPTSQNAFIFLKILITIKGLANHCYSFSVCSRGSQWRNVGERNVFLCIDEVRHILKFLMKIMFWLAFVKCFAKEKKIIFLPDWNNLSPFFFKLLRRLGTFLPRNYVFVCEYSTPPRLGLVRAHTTSANNTIPNQSFYCAFRDQMPSQNAWWSGPNNWNDLGTRTKKEEICLNI